MLKAVFFDNDGVLVDTEILYYEANRTVLAETGIHLSVETYRHISLDQGQSVLKESARAGISETQIAALRLKRDDYYLQLLQRGVRIFPGVREALHALHGLLLTGIVTSSPRTYFETIHAQTGLLPCFDLILTREDYRFSKPNPEPYLLALSRSGFRAEECLVIEDTVRGLESAKAAGIPCIVIPNAFTKQQAFTGSADVIPDMTGLVSLIHNRYINR